VHTLFTQSQPLFLHIFFFLNRLHATDSVGGSVAGVVGADVVDCNVGATVGASVISKQAPSLHSHIPSYRFQLHFVLRKVTHVNGVGEEVGASVLATHALPFHAHLVRCTFQLHRTLLSVPQSNGVGAAVGLGVVGLFVTTVRHDFFLLPLAFAHRHDLYFLHEE